MSELTNNRMPSTAEGIIEKVHHVIDIAETVANKIRADLLVSAEKEEIDDELEDSLMRLLLNRGLSSDRLGHELLTHDDLSREDKVRQIMSLVNEASSDDEAHSFQEVVKDLIHFLDTKMATLKAVLAKSTNIQGA